MCWGEGITGVDGYQHWLSWRMVGAQNVGMDEAIWERHYVIMARIEELEAARPAPKPKPTFPCQFCEKVYASWNNRRMHVRLNHREELK